MHNDLYEHLGINSEVLLTSHTVNAAIETLKSMDRDGEHEKASILSFHLCKLFIECLHKRKIEGNILYIAEKLHNYFNERN